MVQVFAPKPSVSGLPLYFNVDTSVGRGGQNSSVDDIMLVQFFLKLLGRDTTNPDLKPLGDLTANGLMNDATIRGIEAAQRASQIKPDGRVSVARGYKFGASFFTIVTLNFNMRARFPRQWPNVDELPGCPGLLNLACRRALIGTV